MKEYYSLAFDTEYDGDPIPENVRIAAEDQLVAYMNDTGDEPFSIVFKTPDTIIAFFASEGE